MNTKQSGRGYKLLKPVSEIASESTRKWPDILWTNGNKVAAAKLLGIAKTTMYRKAANTKSERRNCASFYDP